MLPDLNNLCNSDIHLVYVGDHRCDFLLRLLLLTLLLLLFLFRLLLLILLGLLLLGVRLLRFFIRRLIATSSLLSFTVGDLLCLGQLFKLRFGWTFRVFIREVAEDLLGSDLVEHAWKVLDMVDPSEGVWELQLLEILETRKVFCHVREHYDVGSSDGSSNQEHPRCHVIVYKIDQLLGGESIDHLDKLANHHPLCGAFTCKEDVLEVAGFRDLHHD